MRQVKRKMKYSQYLPGSKTASTIMWKNSFCSPPMSNPCSPPPTYFIFSGFFKSNSCRFREKVKIYYAYEKLGKNETF